jgi:hypothetical protein
MLDFDEILAGIKNPEIKKYVEESIKSYSVKNYRSAIIAVWIAAMFDLVKKFEILVEQREPTAIEKWSKLQPNIENHKNWETQLIDSAEKVSMISSYEGETLKQLAKTRNRYAHPSFDEVGSLFDPTPEEVRYFIRTLYDIVLSQPAQLGAFYVNQLLEKIKEPRFFIVKLVDKNNILSQSELVINTITRINQRQVPRLVKSLFTIVRHPISDEHKSNALCFISNIWGNNHSTTEIAVQISSQWDEYISEHKSASVIILESILAYPECINRLSEKSQNSIEKVVKWSLKQGRKFSVSCLDFLQYADIVHVAKSVLDDLPNLIDICEIMKLHGYYQEILGLEIFRGKFGVLIYRETRKVLKQGNGYIVNPKMEALQSCGIWDIASSFSIDEQKEFASDLISSLNNNNFSTMNLLNFENRNDIPIKWTKMLLDSWNEKVVIEPLLMRTATVYTEHYLGLLNRHEIEVGDYKETGNILESIIDVSRNENFSKFLNLDENDDAWLFLQKILLRNTNIN